jgi:hypothetical protein
MFMRHAMPLAGFASLAAVGALMMPFALAEGSADVPCTGHQLLPRPRPESSCQNIVAQIYPSPDLTLRASVLPADVSLHATPDMESRVVIRTAGGDTLTSKDYSSPRGTNGYYAYRAQWSPDSQFFVFSLSSSGGHSPWSYPIMVYGRQRNVFARFSDMIGGKPTLSGDFSFSGAHTVVATTWKQPGDLDDKVTVAVDLEEAFGKLPPSPD